MKRGVVWFALLLILSVVTAGCFGTKTPEDVVSDLNKQLGRISGYKTDAVLTLQMGSAPQEYDIQVWYSKPSNYRVALTSKQRNITQIILRNDEGVFVLTPHLQKSFRFQSGWPENNGPLYLYETLVQSIVKDNNRKLQMDNKDYVFEVKADFSGNRSLTRQKIWITSDLKPKRAEIMDDNRNTMVEITFNNFEFDPTFEKDAFDKDKNMTSSAALPAMSKGVAQQKSPSGEFGMIEPTYKPEGVVLQNYEPITYRGNYAVALDYRGTYNYRLIETRPTETSVTYEVGMPVDLGFTIGALLQEDEKRVLIWELDGVEYMLSGNLPEDEMIKVAQSTYGLGGK